MRNLQGIPDHSDHFIYDLPSSDVSLALPFRERPCNLWFNILAKKSVMVGGNMLDEFTVLHLFNRDSLS
jgi:hypothetical protein